MSCRFWGFIFGLINTAIQRKGRTLCRLTVPLVLFVFFNLMAMAQNMSGLPDYGAYVSTGKIDVYDALNGQITLHIPFSGHAYRGFPYQFGQRYSSNIWRPNPAPQP